MSLYRHSQASHHQYGVRYGWSSLCVPCVPRYYTIWLLSDLQQLISDRLKTLQNLVVLLDRIVDPMKRFANYESLFGENELLQNAIAALYCDLLDFCFRIIRYHSRSSFCLSYFFILVSTLAHSYVQ
jgi:hypothetical protein